MVNGIVTHQDWLATFLAAAGELDIKDKLLNGHKVGNKTYKVHIDGFNMLPYLTGEMKESPRESFFYISDDGDILAIRMRDWKVVLMEQRAKTLQCWLEPFVHLRAPKIFHLRRDPARPDPVPLDPLKPGMAVTVRQSPISGRNCRMASTADCA